MVSVLRGANCLSILDSIGASDGRPVDATILQSLGNVLGMYGGGLIQIRKCESDLEQTVTRSSRKPEPRNGFAKKPSPFRIRSRALLDLAAGKQRVRCALATQLDFARSRDAFANSLR